MSIAQWNVHKVMTRADKVSNDALKAAGFILEKDIKESFPGSGSGRKYPGKDRSSSAGEVPVSQTGYLRASITSQVQEQSVRIGSDLDRLQMLSQANIGTDVSYAYYLEAGTRFMEARPYLRPALRRNSRKIIRLFKKYFGE